MLRTVVIACALCACGGTSSSRERARRSEGPPKPAVRLPEVPPPIAPPAATGNCVPAADVDAYAKALEAHTLATLTQLAAADDATLVKRETYYLEGDIVAPADTGPSNDPSVVTVGPGSPYDDQGRITVARKTDGVVRLFAQNPRHHVVEILACGTTCNIQGGAMYRPRTLVFKLAPDETLGPPLVTNVDAWSVYRAELDVHICYGNSAPP